MTISLKQQIYNEMKRRIIECEYRPGEFLTEEMLCEALGASRTPVRDAIGRLEQEQLLTIHPKKGVKVNRVSLRSVNELFEARLRIEPYAVQQYGNRIRDEIYAEFITFFRKHGSASEEMYRRDDEFHQMFVNATENRYLKSFYQIVSDQVMRYRVLSDVDNRTSDSCREHIDIAMNCLRGNWEKAAEAMRTHIENSRLSILNYVLSENLDTHNIFAGQKDAQENLTKRKNKGIWD